MAKSKLTAAAGPRSFPTVNPTTGENGRVHQGHTVDQALSITAEVYQAQIGWCRTPFNARSDQMKKAAQVLRKNRQRYAKLMTDEMGKTVAEGLAELEKCAGACEYFAEHAEGLLKPQARATPGRNLHRGLL